MKQLYSDYKSVMLMLFPKQHRVVTAILFPFVAFSFWFFALAVIGSVDRREYRNNPKYRKVIKEGVVFTTTEYHER